MFGLRFAGGLIPGLFFQVDAGVLGGGAGQAPPPASSTETEADQEALPESPSEPGAGAEQPGVSPASSEVGGAAPTPGADWESDDNPYKRDLEAAARYMGNIELAQIHNDLARAGMQPQHIEIVLRERAARLAAEKKLVSLAQSPAIRRLAAEAAARPYAQYGVTAEDLADAPTPDAMDWYAKKLATQNQKRGLQRRREEGADSVEGTSPSRGRQGRPGQGVAK